MLKIAKGIMTVSLVFALCVNAALPVKAAAGACPSCGSTNTEIAHMTTSSETVKEDCIHGHAGHKDDVIYCVYYGRMYCRACKTLFDSKEYKREEKSRLCVYA